MGRIEKVNQQLKREIGAVIQRELADPRLEFVTIMKVEVSKDLKHAKVHYTVLGSNEKSEDAQNGLEKARGLIRKHVGDNMTMRYTPDLIFIYDDSFELSARMDKTLKEINDQSNENS